MTKEDHGQANAKGWLESIHEMVAKLIKAREGEHDGIGEPDLIEEAHTTITESVLSVEVRSGWYVPGSRHTETGPSPEEYNILLSTGGPALRLIGNLSEHGEPETARLEYQDWGIPWTRYTEFSGEDEAACLTFARCFYFGE